MFIVYATSVPFDFSHAPTLAHAELIPFWDPVRGRLHSIPDIVQNVALFLPYGFLAVLSASGLRAGSAVRAVLMTALLGLALSTAVELIQTMSDLRQTSATDLATNTLGAGAGALAARVFGDHLSGRLHRLTVAMLRTQPGSVVLALLALATFATLLAPFVPSLDVGLLRAKVRALLDHPWGTKAAGALPFDVLVFLGTAFAATFELPAILARALGREARATPALVAAAIGAAAVSSWALVLESAQLPLVHHNPGLREVIANVLGAILGAGIALGLLGKSDARPGQSLGAWTRRWPALVLAFAIAVPLVRALAPFELAPLDQALAKIDAGSFLPFWTLFRHLTFSTFTNVFEAACTYVPLGWALTVLGRRPAVIFAWAAGLAVALELLQIPIAGRTFDPTEGILAASGALVGAWLYQRLVALTREIK